MKCVLWITLFLSIFLFIIVPKIPAQCPWPDEYPFTGKKDGPWALEKFEGKKIGTWTYTYQNKIFIKIIKRTEPARENGLILQQSPHPSDTQLVKKGTKVELIVNCKDEKIQDLGSKQIKQVINYQDNRKWTIVYVQPSSEKEPGSIYYKDRQKRLEIATGREIMNIGDELASELRVKHGLDIKTLDLRGYYVQDPIVQDTVIIRDLQLPAFKGGVSFSFAGELQFTSEKPIKIDTHVGRFTATCKLETQVPDRLYGRVKDQIAFSLQRFIDEKIRKMQAEQHQRSLESLRKVSDILLAISGGAKRLSNEERLERLRRIELQ